MNMNRTERNRIKTIEDCRNIEFSIFCFKMSGNKNYYKFVFDWNMYKTGSISESLTPYPPVTDEKYPCQDEGNG